MASPVEHSLLDLWHADRFRTNRSFAGVLELSKLHKYLISQEDWNNSCFYCEILYDGSLKFFFFFFCNSYKNKINLLYLQIGCIGRVHTPCATTIQNRGSRCTVNIAFPLFPAALAIFSSLAPLFSLLHIRLCLRVLTQSRWLGKHVKNLSPVSATFEAPSPFFFLSPLKFHHKVIFAKYPVNSIKVICFPFSL